MNIAKLLKYCAKVYLEDAKQAERELTCKYEAYMWGD